LDTILTFAWGWPVRSGLYGVVHPEMDTAMMRLSTDRIFILFFSFFSDTDYFPARIIAMTIQGVNHHSY
ncbi:MAG: hypothetical protein ACAH83_02525, partial [Alphaproteobacteria bacterium]